MSFLLREEGNVCMTRDTRGRICLILIFFCFPFPLKMAAKKKKEKSSKIRGRCAISSFLKIAIFLGQKKKEGGRTS